MTPLRPTLTSLAHQGGVMLVPGRRLAVFSIRAGKNGSVWVRAGWAEVNRDDSVNLHLDVLPVDGKLHVREVGGGLSSPAEQG